MGTWHTKVTGKFGIVIAMIVTGLAGYFGFSGDNNATPNAVTEDVVIDPTVAPSSFSSTPDLYVMPTQAANTNVTKGKSKELADIASIAASSSPLYLPPKPPVKLPALVPVSESIVSSSSPGAPRAVVPLYTTPIAKPPPQYTISLSTMGAGSGFVSSTPDGILCGFTCRTSFPSGTLVTLAASPNARSLFKAWSGACTGVTSSLCSFAVSGERAVVATFELAPVDPPPVANEPPIETNSDELAESSSTDATSTSTAGGAINHLVIVQVQLAGVARSDSFVKIFNPTTRSVDIGGWKLRKRSSTGGEYSLREIAKGSVILSGGYFMWANSKNGFASSTNADVGSAETLAANNSVGLLSSDGTLVDAVAWGIGTNQFGEGVAFATNPASNQVLIRKSAEGNVIDTDNNASDFMLQ
jgi:hypothetical protein